jgi:hypothetical protein
MGPCVTRHNYLQKRSRLLKAMRDASTSYLWSCNQTTPQARRATTLAAKRLMERSRDLWKLGVLPRGDEGSS